MAATTFPGKNWNRVTPADASMNPEKLDRAGQWLAHHATEGRYRGLVLRRGCIVAEWYGGVAPDEQLGLASSAKSIYSCVLGIAIKEGSISSADARLADLFPEALNVPPGTGPKSGRHVFDKDCEITLRQLISNTSGYMKPGENPGTVFHYQTFGMNVVAHSIANAYGLYDVGDPDGSPGIAQLIDEWLREPIGGSWSYYVKNFQHPPQARTGIFGYYTDLLITTHDMARLGWLWLNWGRWRDGQVIPEAWLREATQTAPAIRKHCPRPQWKYGYAFWTNSHDELVPGLPTDSYAALGAGGTMIWVCPSLELVVALNPGLDLTHDDDSLNHGKGFLKLIVEACT